MPSAYDLLMEPVGGDEGIDEETEAKKRNLQRAVQRGYVKDPTSSYQTGLTDAEEQLFAADVKAGKLGEYVDTSPTSDYDMKGFWAGLKQGDPEATTAINPNDKKLHYPDKWKTPYHDTFSKFSQYADPAHAPEWRNDNTTLVDPATNETLFDEKPRPQEGGTSAYDLLMEPQPPDIKTATDEPGKGLAPESSEGLTLHDIMQVGGPTAVRMIPPLVGGYLGGPVVGALAGAGGEIAATAMEGQPQSWKRIGLGAAGGAVAPVRGALSAGEAAARMGLIGMGFDVGGRAINRMDTGQGELIGPSTLIGAILGAGLESGVGLYGDRAAAAARVREGGAGIPIPIPTRTLENPLPDPTARQVVQEPPRPPGLNYPQPPEYRPAVDVRGVEGREIPVSMPPRVVTPPPIESTTSEVRYNPFTGEWVGGPRPQTMAPSDLQLPPEAPTPAVDLANPDWQPVRRQPMGTPFEAAPEPAAIQSENILGAREGALPPLAPGDYRLRFPGERPPLPGEPGGPGPYFGQSLGGDYFSEYPQRGPTVPTEAPPFQEPLPPQAPELPSGQTIDAFGRVVPSSPEQLHEASVVREMDAADRQRISAEVADALRAVPDDTGAADRLSPKEAALEHLFQEQSLAAEPSGAEPSIAEPPPAPGPDRTLQDILGPRPAVPEAQGFHLGEPTTGEAPTQPVSIADLSKATREAQASLAEAEQKIAQSRLAERGGRGDISPAEVAIAVRQRDQAAQRLSVLEEQMRSQRGSVVSPLTTRLTTTGIGGLSGGAYGSQIGDTPEERQRNMILYGLAGAGVGALAPTMLGKIMGHSTPPPPVRPPTPHEELMLELGNKARLIERRKSFGDYDQAHAVADSAWQNLEEIRKHVGEITPNNRLFRVVDGILFPEGGNMSERFRDTATGAGQVLQRFSDLAKALKKMGETDPEAAKLASILYNGKDTLFRQMMSAFRGLAVGRISTAMRNAYDQGKVVGSSALDKFFTGITEGYHEGKVASDGGYFASRAAGVKEALTGGLKTGTQDAFTIGQVATRRAWEGMPQFLRLAKEQPEIMQAILDHFPKLAEKALGKQEGLEGPLGDFLTQHLSKKLGPEMGTRIGKEIDAKLSTYMKWANYVNNAQELFFKGASLESSLRNGLRHAGIDVEAAFRDPTLIPESIMAKATHEALVNTFANSPKSALARELVQVWANHPSLYAVLPFPRYIANRMQYIAEHNPASFMRVFTEGRKRNTLQEIIDKNQQALSQAKATGATTIAAKARSNIAMATERMGELDTPAQVMGKWASGMTMMAAGMALRHSSIAGEHWWEAKPTPGSDKRIDFRQDATLAQYMFAGELLEDVRKHGRITMSASDLSQGLGIGGVRSGIGIQTLNVLSGQKHVSMDDAFGLAGDLVGTFGSAYLNPIGQLRDLIPGESTMRQTHGGFLSRALAPIANQIPFARDYLPAQASATRPEERTQEYAPAHFLGVTMTQPTDVERAFAENQITPQQILPYIKKYPEAQNALTEAQGQVLPQMAERVLNSRRYQLGDDLTRQMMLGDLLTGARERAKTKLPLDMRRQIEFANKDKIEQERLRRQGRAPAE